MRILRRDVVILEVLDPWELGIVGVDGVVVLLAVVSALVGESALSVIVLIWAQTWVEILPFSK